jgi:hypothetical protein
MPREILGTLHRVEGQLLRNNIGYFRTRFTLTWIKNSGRKAVDRGKRR